MNYATLKEEVKYHDKLYFIESKPKISDSDYDILYDRLVQLEKTQGYRDYDSPTVKAGAIDHRQGKVKHPRKLYSLNKVYSRDEVPSDFVVETPKLDGACVAIHMSKGKLVSVVSRGDGEYGENITFLLADKLQNLLQITNPKYLGNITIVCEATTGQQVDNYRNYVSGALNLKNKTEFQQREIELIAHDVLGVDEPYLERLGYIGKFMLTVLSKSEYLKKVPVDGVVYRTNSVETEKSLGYTSKYPKFAVALKTRAKETAVTTLTSVIWSIGRTGVVSPVGIVDPVIIGGATISRLTLNNIAFIEENDICIGDSIEIERAGEIIPAYIRTVSKSPIRIPITIQNAEEGISTKVLRSGPKLYVVDKSINEEKAILHFATQMNIQGLGPASITKLQLHTITDLYKDQNWSVLGANGLKIAQEIEYSKTKPYENVLSGLGIPNVGLSLARKIIQHIPKFENLYLIEYEKIEKIGPKITNKILVWFEENNSWVKKLPLQLEQVISKDSIRRVVCITGTLDRSRTEIANILESKGFEVKDSISKKTHLLITDGKIQSDKVKKAISYGIPIINYFKNKQKVLEGEI